jgi:hypothetical protein
MAEAPTSRNRFHDVPVIGWIARDIAQEPDSVWYALVIVLTLFVLAFATWGVMVLSLLALATVPVIFAIMILITLG